MAKKNVELCGEFKPLRQWTEELLKFDDFTRFLDLCKWEKKPRDIISYTEFLTLKEKYGF